MEIVVPLLALLALIFLVGRRVPNRSILAVLAITLAACLAIVLAERAGFWPASWVRR